MDGVFVTGVDTNVGKTILCAGLLKLMHGSRKVCYWKPIQTGTIVGDDTSDIRAVVELGEENFVEPIYRFPEPLAPHMAAAKWGKKIEIDSIMSSFEDIRRSGRFVVIEGAGGLMLPLNDDDLQIDLIKRLSLPLIIVAQDRVGAINQVLLTLNASRDHQLTVMGVVLTKSRGSYGNAEGIAKFGKVEVLAEFPPTDDSRGLVSQVTTHDRLRKAFNVAVIP